MLAGEAVTWFNRNTVEHTATFLENDMLDSGFLERGGAYTHIFEEPGEFDYHSKHDPLMTGTIIVERPFFVQAMIKMIFPRSSPGAVCVLADIFIGCRNLPIV